MPRAGVEPLSQLVMLNRLGKYRGEYVKRLIGEYAGLRHGEMWERIQKAEVKFKEISRY